jgi:hypothetical protein
MGHLITTAEQLAEAIVTDPERVAACVGRINAALCDVVTRISTIEGSVRGVRLRLIEDDAEGQVP